MGLRGWLRYSGALSCFPRPEMTYHAISFGTTVHVRYSEPTQYPASSITTACVILQVIRVHLSRRDTARSTSVRELNSTTSITWHTRIMPTLHTSKMITDRFAYHASTVYNNTAPFRHTPPLDHGLSCAVTSHFQVSNKCLWVPTVAHSNNKHPIIWDFPRLQTVGELTGTTFGMCWEYEHQLWHNCSCL